MRNKFLIWNGLTLISKELKILMLDLILNLFSVESGVAKLTTA